MNTSSNANSSGRCAVTVQSVTKIFDSGGDSVTALDDVSLEIRENEFFTLLGPSGCGKTTLLRLIAGFGHPDSGHIQLYEKDITFLPPYERPVNTFFQSYALFPHMTVAQNISFGLEMLRKPKAQIKDTIDSILRLVRMDIRVLRSSENGSSEPPRAPIHRQSVLGRARIAVHRTSHRPRSHRGQRASSQFNKIERSGLTSQQASLRERPVRMTHYLDLLKIGCDLPV